MKKVLLSLSLLFLFACGGNNEEKTASKETAKMEQKMDENQELNTFLAAEPKTIDSSRGTDSYSGSILGLTNEGLIGTEATKDGMDKLVPAGAESWKVSEDKKIWTFKLRKDAVWADGKPVKAEDYYYGITRTLNPEVGSTYAFLLYPIKGAKAYNLGKGKLEDVGIKVLDDYTLEITLDNPTAYFGQLCYFRTMYPLRKDIVEKYGEAYGSEASQIMANGPYLLKEWVHNSKVTFEKNPKYWNSKEFKLDRINMLIVRDENSRMNLIMNGQVDMGAASKPEWVEQFMKSGDFINIKRYALGTNYNLFNTKNEYFKNAKIRKAFILATDREELNKVMFNGTFEPAYGFVSKGILLGDKEYRTLVPGPIKKLAEENKDPKALLIEGLKELGKSPDPSQMTVTYLSSGTDSWARKYSEFMQQMYKTKLGVNIKAEFVEWPVYQKRNQELDYDMGGQAWTADYNDPNTFLDMWVSSANIVPNGWKNEKYDKLIEKAALTADNKEREELFKQAEEILLYEDAVISPTLYRTINNYCRKYVKNYNPATLGPYNYKGVYIEGRE